MPRQRIGLPHTFATGAGRRAMAIPAVALVYGGGVILALAAGIAPADLDRLTGYSTVVDRLGGLDPADWSQGVSIAVAIAGAIGLLLLVVLGWAQRPIPHTTRSPLVLRDEDDGVTTVSPRAIERAAEIAASRHAGVRAAKATAGDDDIGITLHARRAELIPEALRDAKSAARTALDAAGVPASTTVRVAVTRFSPASKKDLLR